LNGRILYWLILGSSLILQSCSQTPTKTITVTEKNVDAQIQQAVAGDGPPLFEHDLEQVAQIIPQHEPISRYGNPPTYEVFGKKYNVLSSSVGYQEQGKASWYGRKFHGQRTSSGEPYDMLALTAAHRSLPLPTYAKVKNIHNGKEIIVKINDRGPFVHDRIIDLSYAAAKKLGIFETGTGHVEVTAIDPHKWHLENAPILAKTNSQTMAKKQPLTTLANTPPASKTMMHTAVNNVSQRDPKKLYIQLGSFSKKFNAQQLAQQAQSLTQTFDDLQIHIHPFQTSNNELYRVKIGPLSDASQAQLLQKKWLSLNGMPSNLIYE